MSRISDDDVRIFIAGHLATSPSAAVRPSPAELPADLDLLLSGTIDSLGLLELVGALSELAGRELDFDLLGPEEMTVVGPLCRFVAEQAAATDSYDVAAARGDV